MGELIKRKLTSPGGKKLRVRADTFGYLQRSFAGVVSEVDATEAREVARRAVRYSTDPSKVEGSVVMVRKSNTPYTIDYDFTSIKNVARETKHLDTSWITNGRDIAQGFIDYAKPLVGKLPVVGTFDELKK